MQTTFWNGLPSSASACRSKSKSIFEIIQESQRPSDLDNDQVTAREGWDDANNNLFSILYFTTSGSAFSVVRRFEGRIREGGLGHGQDAWAALREKFDGCSREALRPGNREMETVKMRPDEDPDDFLLYIRRTGAATA